MAGPGNTFGNASTMQGDQLINFLMEQFGVNEHEALRLMATANFARNDPHALPPASYMTNLGPSQEPQFEQWAKSKDFAPFYYNAPFPPLNLRGYWQDLTNLRATSPQTDLEGHIEVPPEYDTPYSSGFGPRSLYYRR